jgi:hypothetical protein
MEAFGWTELIADCRLPIVDFELATTLSVFLQGVGSSRIDDFFDAPQISIDNLQS